MVFKKSKETDDSIYANLDSTGRPLLREVSSYAIRSKPKTASVIYNRTVLRWLWLTAVFVVIAGALSYSVALTLRMKEYQVLLEANKRNEEYLIKLDSMSKDLNEYVYSMVNKSNELCHALGIEKLNDESIVEVAPHKDSEAPLLSNEEIVTLLKNIKAQRVISGNTEIGQIAFGDKVVLQFVGTLGAQYNAGDRAEKILQRIRKLIYDRVTYDKIVIRPYEEDEYGILVDNQLVFTISGQEASFFDEELVKHARSQAEAFHRALIDFNRTYLLAFIRDKLQKKHIENKTSGYNPEKIHQRFVHLTEVVNKVSAFTEDFETTLHRYQERFKCTPSIRPIRGQLSSGFGYRISPFSGKLAYHSGVDMLAMPGTSVKSTADGYVTYTGWHGGYGLIVKINHGYNVSTLYGHLSKINVKQGQFVKKGQVVARSGNTGLSTGPHLHYEVICNGKYTNPSNYFNLDILTAQNVW